MVATGRQWEETVAERIGLYPGTFDPVTNGHMDIIVRAAGIVDKLVVAVAVNAGKGPLFSLDERVALLREELKAMNNGLIDRVEIRPFQSLLMHFAESVGAKVIIRGLRAVSDFDYEFQMAGTNRRLNPQVETVFLMASETNQFISSRFVKEIARLGGDIGHFVSPRVVKRVAAALRQPAPDTTDGATPTIPIPAIRTPL
ncbi:MAG TPA: pantetheine-phosphate adenylyltransferase [Alphaproteobacteria bacterium]|nr:pantetheine-phosphate adenylyltransferase [Alphaproteobacteria bacterium]